MTLVFSSLDGESRGSNIVNQCYWRFPKRCDIDRRTLFEETDCEYWPYKNIYTRCDGFWTCPFGEDEENCTARTRCPSHSLTCVSPSNHTLTCSLANGVNDGRVDCLGAADELQFCRSRISEAHWHNAFRC